MKERIGAPGGPNAITAQSIREAYTTAAPRWKAPDAADCEAIAATLSMCRNSQTEREARRLCKPDAAGRRRMARAENVREAIGTLLLDLPALVEHLDGRIAPSTEHAESLADLLRTTRAAAALWPSLDGSQRKFDPRSEWSRTADCIVGQMLAAWQRANPGRRIGKPLSPDQPATKLMVNLLAKMGYDEASPDADRMAGRVAKHFNRDKSGFVLLEAAANS